MREVFRRVLRVEGNEVVHGGSLSPHVSDKFLELSEGCNIFQNDDGRAKEEDEFKHCVEATAWVAPSLLMPEG